MSAEDVMRFRNPFETNGQQFAESDLIAALAELTATAREANVTFYTIDPRGLQAGPDISTNLTNDEFWANARSLDRFAESAGQRNRRLLHVRQERLHEGVAAHRQRDERLLPARIRIVESRSAQGCPKN
jgi:hypothetical protein